MTLKKIGESGPRDIELSYDASKGKGYGPFLSVAKVYGAMGKEHGFDGGDAAWRIVAFA